MNKPRLSPFLFCGLIALVYGVFQGSTLDLCDDEAYYWTLAQQFRWGIAYHPPLTLWALRLGELLFAPLTLCLPNLTPRLAPLAFTFLSIYLLNKRLNLKSFHIYAFSPLFLLSFLVVPDAPYFLGWTCFLIEVMRLHLGQKISFPFLLLAATSMALSKYTFFLTWITLFWILFLLLFKKIQSKATLSVWIKTTFTWISFTLIASLPHFLWLQEHDYPGLRFQFLDRHDEFQFNLISLVRFWLLQLILFGPMLFISFWKHLRSNTLWLHLSLPSLLLFTVQSFSASCKIHWIWVSFWPLWIGECLNPNQPRKPSFYPIFLGALLLTLTQTPILSFISQKLMQTSQPLTDLYFDFHGLQQIQIAIKKLEKDYPNTPFIATRYQVISQIERALKLNSLQSGSLLNKSTPNNQSTPLFVTFPASWEIQDWRLFLGTPSLNRPSTLTQSGLFFSDARFNEPWPQELLNANCPLVYSNTANLSFLGENLHGRLLQVYFCKPE